MRKNLADRAPHPRRPLPQPPAPAPSHDPFTLLIAVLLSAIGTDERVNSVTPALFALASTPQAMARLSVEEIRKIIRPCGLSLRKATAIKAALCRVG